MTLIINAEIRSQLEYASDVWDPHHVWDIMQLEKVQRRVAHWVLNDCDRFSSVTLMLYRSVIMANSKQPFKLVASYLDNKHCTKCFINS